jgi:hypothetical protein
MSDIIKDNEFNQINEDCTSAWMRLGQLLNQAGLGADHPAMKDWASVGFKLKELEAMVIDFQQTNDDHTRLIRELDTACFGENAAEQASLCDLVKIIPEEIKNLKHDLDQSNHFVNENAELRSKIKSLILNWEEREAAWENRAWYDEEGKECPPYPDYIEELKDLL